jgi:hypothetical protein
MFALLLFGDALAFALLILTVVKRKQPIMRYGLDVIRHC